MFDFRSIDRDRFLRYPFERDRDLDRDLDDEYRNFCRLFRDDSDRSEEEEIDDERLQSLCL